MKIMMRTQWQLKNVFADVNMFSSLLGKNTLSRTHTHMMMEAE
jgi:hypothetical protein